MKKIASILFALVMALSLAATVAAAPGDFVPSAEVKPGPGIVEKPDEDGKTVIGQIVMPDGTIIKVPGGAIVITPIKDADSAKDPSITDDLNASKDDVDNVGSLDDLVDSLQDILDQIADGVDVDDLVITDMFHIYISDEYVEYLEEGGVLQITLKVPEGTLLTLTDINGVWGALFGDKFVDNGDGTYTLYITDIGTYAFVKDSGKVDVDPDSPGVSSPTTGDNTIVYVLMGSAFAMAAVAFLVAAKKQKA